MSRVIAAVDHSDVVGTRGPHGQGCGRRSGCLAGGPPRRRGRRRGGASTGRDDRTPGASPVRRSGRAARPRWPRKRTWWPSSSAPAAHPGGARPAGHVAMGLAGRTDKPVVVVPPGSHPPEQLRTAVVAMEGTPGKARALQRSIAISARAGLEIVVVHVHDEDSIPSFSDQVQHEAEAYASEFFSRHLISAPRMRLELRVGIPADEVLDAVESARAELVAVGWPPVGGSPPGGRGQGDLGRSPVAVLLVAIAVSGEDVESAAPATGVSLRVSVPEPRRRSGGPPGPRPPPSGRRPRRR